MTAKLAVIMFALCMISAMVSAQSVTDESSPDLATYREQQQQLQTALAGNDPEYADLTPRQRTKVRKAGAEILAVLEGRSSYDELDIEEKIRLRNAQQQQQAFLAANTAKAEQAQDECWQERVSGTRIMKTRCASKAEREQIRQETQGFLLRPKTCGVNCGEQL